MSYAWTQTSGPNVTLTGADTATPSLTAPSARGVSRTLVFQLAVNKDNDGSTTDSVTVTVRPAYQPALPTLLASRKKWRQRPVEPKQWPSQGRSDR